MIDERRRLRSKATSRVSFIYIPLRSLLIQSRLTLTPLVPTGRRLGRDALR